MTDPLAYRKAMAQFATGVTVVTTGAGGVIHGMTANAVASVSLDPPTLLIVVGRDNDTHHLVPEAGVFAVNVLAGDQRWISERFAEKDKGPHLFDGVAWHPGELGAPLIEGALAHLECTLTGSHAAGDHTIYLGRVDILDHRDEGDPLVYFRSGYHTAGNAGH